MTMTLQPDVLVHLDGAGRVRITRPEDPDTVATLGGDGVDHARALALTRVRNMAEEEDRPLRVRTTDPDGEWLLLVHPDGHLEEAPSEPPAAPVPAPGVAGGVELPSVANLRATRPAPRPGRAEWGWQAGVRRATLGKVSPTPGPAELAHRRDVVTVQRSLDGPRKIVVGNTKGGVRKTSAVLALGATFGRHRGGAVLAWDNNENRGTLGMRAMTQPGQTNTAVELLRDLRRFTGPDARLGDLDNYVRRQGSQLFDVLASTEDPARRDAIGREEFEQLAAVLERWYRLLIVDTGNAPSPCWWGAMTAADALVVPVPVAEDGADHAAFMLDQLLAAGRVDLVRDAVVVLSGVEGAPRRLTARVRDHFQSVARVVLTVPEDPALGGGRPIDYEALTRASQEAWLRVAAAVAEAL